MSRKNLSRLTTGLAVLAAVAGLTAPAAAAAEPPHAATQKAIETQRSARAAIGAGAVVREGDTMWSLTSGTRMLGQNLPFGPEHKVRGGSLAKSFTATIILQLVDEGRISLDGKVEQYLPGVLTGAYDGNQITVRQLLNHSSGIFDYVQVALTNPQLQLRRFTLAEVAALGLANPPYFAPGQGWRYSGTNFILLGMMIEKLTGRTYPQELNSRIIAPLGLTETFVPEGTKALPPGHVRGYVGRIFYLDVTQVFEPSLGGSSGGIVTSGADATKFFQSLVTGKLFSAARLKEMLTPHVGPNAPVTDYGLGMMRFPLPCGGEAWGHNGLWPGYESNVAATADGRSAFVTLNNFDIAMGTSGSAGPLAEATKTALCDR